MQKNLVPDICVYSGGIPLPPYALKPINGVYILMVGEYFTVDVLVKGQQEMVTWHTKGDIIGEYSPALNGTHLTIPSEQMQAKQFTGTWWKAGKQTISIDTQFGNFLLSFLVSAPSLDIQSSQFGLAIGKPVAEPFAIPTTAPAKNWLVLAGGASVPNRQLHGIEITCFLDPFPAGGQVAFIQLIQTSREAQFSTQPKQTLQSNGAVLDNGHNPATYWYKDPVILPLQQALQISMNDGPAVALDPPAISVTINDQFRTFLMFRPNGHQDLTTWIPLGVVSWGWGASASLQGNNWQLLNPHTTPPVLEDILNKTAQQAFPLWNAIVTSIPWH